MQITKSSENYSISASLENGWEVSGSINNTSTNTSINFDIRKQSEVDEIEEITNIGNFYWGNGDMTRNSYSFSVEKGINAIEFFETCHSLVLEALEELNK